MNEREPTYWDVDCMWCGGNQRLETYTAEGEVEDSAACVCVMREEWTSEVRQLRERATALEDGLRALLAAIDGNERKRDASFVADRWSYVKLAAIYDEMDAARALLEIAMREPLPESAGASEKPETNQ